MQYSTLISQIEADIYSNGMELITGDILQNVLKDMISALAAAGACYGGAINTGSAAPADLDQATFYLATEPGEYTNYVDSNNDPLVIQGPSLIVFDGGASLVFSAVPLTNSRSVMGTVGDGDNGAIIVNVGDISGSSASVIVALTGDYTGGSSYSSTVLLIIKADDLAGVIECTAIGDTDQVTGVYLYNDSVDSLITITLDISFDFVAGTIIDVSGRPVNAHTAASPEGSLVYTGTVSPVGGAGAVRYDQAQTLSTAEQEQARANIGAIDSASKDYAQNDPTNGEYIKNRPGGFDVYIGSSAEEIISSDFSDAGDGYFVVPLTTLNNPGLVEAMKAGITVPVLINYDEMEETGTAETMSYNQEENEVRITNSTSLSSFTYLYIDYSGLPNVSEVDMEYWMKVLFKEEYVPKEVFWATYGTTKYADALAAYQGGKIVCCLYQDRVYVAAYYISGNNQIRFYSHIGGSTALIILNSSDVWSSGGSYTYEQSANKVSTISGNETDTTKYPNTKAVADALGKMGVISQTQTWSGTGSNPRTYVMSDQVYGIIPQSFIDLATSAGATFNATSGYFELNGLTDLSYAEMRDVMRYDLENQAPVANFKIFARTNIKPTITKYYMNYYTWDKTAFCQNPSSLPLGYHYVESLNVGSDGEITLANKSFFFINQAATTLFFGNHYFVKKIYGVIDVSGVSSFSASFFQSCYSLERVLLFGVKANLNTLKDSPNLSEESLLFMINNCGTATFTITLHASVYAKCISGGDWYTDISTALSAHTNVSLASA